MKRRWLTRASVSAAAFAFAFLGGALASGADSDSPSLRPNLPARALPVTPIPATDGLAILNMLQGAGEAVGITEASLASARTVAESSSGSIYLLPGTKGTCLVIAQSAACGDPGSADSAMNAIVTLSKDGDTLIGGAVVTQAVSEVDVIAGDRYRASFDADGGVVAIKLHVPGFRPGDGVRFIAR